MSSPFEKSLAPAKKQRRKKIMVIIVSAIFGLALGAAGFVVLKQFGPDVSASNQTGPKPEVSARTTADPLDGTQVPRDKANRHPLAVIVENHSQARPQSGLDKASIVYEAISEGGITRFMAIYGPNDASKIGPVRSVRTYFLDWAAEYNAFIAHVGGNIDALDRIQPEGFLDLDEFGIGEPTYWRIPSRTKAIEHTMYTDSAKLYQEAEKKGWNMKGDVQSLKFLDPKKFKVNSLLRQDIIIDFSSYSYKVEYSWDGLNNKYNRSMAGSLHKDSETGNQLAPTNIIIQEVPRTEGTTRINENSWTMSTIGEGKAYILYGGQKQDATWKKKDLHSRTLFYDAAGKEIEFLPGQIWYEIIPPDVFAKVEIITEEATPAP